MEYQCPRTGPILVSNCVNCTCYEYIGPVQASIHYQYKLPTPIVKHARRREEKVFDVPCLSLSVYSEVDSAVYNIIIKPQISLPDSGCKTLNGIAHNNTNAAILENITYCFHCIFLFTASFRKTVLRSHCTSW